MNHSRISYLMPLCLVVSAVVAEDNIDTKIKQVIDSALQDEIHQIFRDTNGPEYLIRSLSRERAIGVIWNPVHPEIMVIIVDLASSRVLSKHLVGDRKYPVELLQVAMSRRGTGMVGWAQSGTIYLLRLGHKGEIVDYIKRRCRTESFAFAEISEDELLVANVWEGILSIMRIVSDAANESNLAGIEPQILSKDVIDAAPIAITTSGNQGALVWLDWGKLPDGKMDYNESNVRASFFQVSKKEISFDKTRVLGTLLMPHDGPPFGEFDIKLFANKHRLTKAIIQWNPFDELTEVMKMELLR